MTAGVTNSRYTLPVFTGRVDGPCSQVVLTGAREHGPRTRTQCVPSPKSDSQAMSQTAFPLGIYISVMRFKGTTGCWILQWRLFMHVGLLQHVLKMLRSWPYRCHRWTFRYHGQSAANASRNVTFTCIMNDQIYYKRFSCRRGTARLFTSR